jgi:hypothetical protein
MVRVESSAPIATQPVSSVLHTEPPPGGGVPHAGVETTWPPVSAQSDLLSAIVHYTSAATDAPSTKRLLINQIDHTVEDVQAVGDLCEEKGFPERLRNIRKRVSNAEGQRESG